MEDKLVRRIKTKKHAFDGTLKIRDGTIILNIASSSKFKEENEKIHEELKKLLKKRFHMIPYSFGSLNDKTREKQCLKSLCKEEEVGR